MKRISSRMTHVYKHIFPRIVFGFLGFFACFGIIATIVLKDLTTLFMFVGAPVAPAVFAYFVLHALVFDLADEVWDAGDELAVKIDGRESRIPVSDIARVAYNGFVTPPRATLLFKRQTEVGRCVAFSPPFRFFAYWKPKVVRELAGRITV